MTHTFYSNRNHILVIPVVEEYEKYLYI